MLPPIFPRPSIASCMAHLLSGDELCGLLQRLHDLAGVAPILEVDAQRAPPVRLQYLQVAAGLGREEGSERERQAGDRQVLSAVAGDLHEQPGVGAALVQLAGGVEEAGPEPERAG